jgi:hypothetical protein
MRKRNLIRAATVLAVTVVVLLGALAVDIYLRTRPWVRITTAQVESDIRDHLPIGSSRAEVATYLDSKKIAHSYVSDDKYAGPGNYEIALIRDTASSGFVMASIQIHFNFDSKLKLVSYSVHQVYTGP